MSGADDIPIGSGVAVGNGGDLGSASDADSGSGDAGTSSSWGDGESAPGEGDGSSGSDGGSSSSCGGESGDSGDSGDMGGGLSGGGLGGCLNIATDPAEFDLRAPGFVTDICLELVRYLSQSDGRYPSGNAQKAVIAALWGLPSWDSSLRVHHLIGQHLVTGVNYATNAEHRALYESIYHSPLLCVPIAHSQHMGPGSIHSQYGFVADIQGVDLSDGLYAGLANLSPENYLNVTLSAFEKVLPDVYDHWCEIVWNDYYKV